MRHVRAALSVLTVCAIAACSDATAPTPTPTPRTFPVVPIFAVGPFGSVTITNDPGENSTLTATLSGFEANSTHPVAIINGTCDAPASVLLTLPNVDANSSGQLSISATSVPDEAVTTDHAIVFFESPSNSGFPLACGNLA
jgi:hypothetical protein